MLSPELEGVVMSAFDIGIIVSIILVAMVIMGVMFVCRCLCGFFGTVLDFCPKNGI